MKRLTSAILILFLCFTVSIPLVNATSYTFGSTTHSASGKTTPGASDFAGAAKIRPVSSTDTNFTNVQMFAYIDVDAGNAKGVIWNGTDGAVIEVSTDIRSVDGAAWAAYDFSTNLENYTYYYFGVIFDIAGCDIYFDTVEGQNLWYETNSYTTPESLEPADTASCAIYITCDGATGGYTLPGDFGYTGTSDEFIAAFMQFIVPLLVILLPAILLVVFTRSTDKWILLIGLTIGIGLGYAFGLVPLWLVFLIVIGLIGMAYQSVRGGG